MGRKIEGVHALVQGTGRHQSGRIETARKTNKLRRLVRNGGQLQTTVDRLKRKNKRTRRKTTKSTARATKKTSERREKLYTGI